MIKHIIIGLSLSIIMQASAMEIQPTIDDKKLCYLTCMPVDVQNHILFFVKDDETEEEFIARIKNLEKSYAHELCAKYNLYAKHGRHDFHDIAFCLDESKYVFYDWTSRLLRLVDRKEDKILHSKEICCNNRIFLMLALSRHANMIAMFERSSHTEEIRNGVFHVVIENIVTHKKWEFERSLRFGETINVFEFNKQGTHLIIKGSSICLQSSNEILPHLIVPIFNEKKKIDTLLKIEDFNQKTPLQQYLIERRICKSIEYKK